MSMQEGGQTDPDSIGDWILVCYSAVLFVLTLKKQFFLLLFTFESKYDFVLSK